jgi:hypothetical protein
MSWQSEVPLLPLHGLGLAKEVVYEFRAIPDQCPRGIDLALEAPGSPPAALDLKRHAALSLVFIDGDRPVAVYITDRNPQKTFRSTFLDCRPELDLIRQRYLSDGIRVLAESITRELRICSELHAAYGMALRAVEAHRGDVLEAIAETRSRRIELEDRLREFPEDLGLQREIAVRTRTIQALAAVLAGNARSLDEILAAIRAQSAKSLKGCSETAEKGERVLGFLIDGPDFSGPRDGLRAALSDWKGTPR